MGHLKQPSHSHNLGGVVIWVLIDGVGGSFDVEILDWHTLYIYGMIYEMTLKTTTAITQACKNIPLSLQASLETQSTVLNPNHSSDVSFQVLKRGAWVGFNNWSDVATYGWLYNFPFKFIQKLPQPQQWCFFQVLKRGALASTIGVMRPHMDDCTIFQKLAILSSFYNF